MSRFNLVIATSICLFLLHLAGCAFYGVRGAMIWKWFVWGYSGSGLYAGFATLWQIGLVAVSYLAIGIAVRRRQGRHARDPHDKPWAKQALKWGCGGLLAFAIIGVLFGVGASGLKAAELFAVAAFLSVSVGFGTALHRALQ